ncbi:MAG: hypothetical protein MJ158_00250 [Alphaproteobacteria bacterium]|nr:hypothetical protein [Alphaproteobacteria bacterium]
MAKKLILTSLFSMMVVSPSIADMLVEQSAPIDGKYLENRKYLNAATRENIGVSSGNVTAIAVYEDIQYTCPAGEYLYVTPDENDNTIECRICESGNFCNGGNYTIDNHDDDMTSCPTDFASSLSGAKSVNECFRECLYTDVEHSNVNGTFTGQYYSNSVNKCAPVNDSSCADGYHYVAGMSGLNVDVNINGIDSTNSVVLNDDAFSVSFNYGKIYGNSLCSNTSGPTGTIGTPSNENGGYCWCNINGYDKNATGTESVYSSWVAVNYSESFDTCSSNCSATCANAIKTNADFRGQIYNTISTLAKCSSNVITITWTDTDKVDVDANNAGTCLYDGDIRTPVKAYSKKGKRFVGWEFETTK